MPESGRPSMRPLWDGSRGYTPEHTDHFDQKWFPEDPSLGAPVVPYRHRARKLHPMQWVTYIFVIITCIAVLYSLINTYIFLGNLQEAIAELGKSFQNLGVN